MIDIGTKGIQQYAIDRLCKKISGPGRLQSPESVTRAWISRPPVDFAAESPFWNRRVRIGGELSRWSMSTGRYPATSFEIIRTRTRLALTGVGSNSPSSRANAPDKIDPGESPGKIRWIQDGPALLSKFMHLAADRHDVGMVGGRARTSIAFDDVERKIRRFAPERQAADCLALQVSAPSRTG